MGRHVELADPHSRPTAKYALEIISRVEELADYFRLAGKTPEKIVVHAPDFRALVRGTRALLLRNSRNAAHSENARRRAEGIKGRVHPAEVDEIESLTLRGIRIVEGPGYSKHRPVDFAPSPTPHSTTPAKAPAQERA